MKTSHYLLSLIFLTSISSIIGMNNKEKDQSVRSQIIPYKNPEAFHLPYAPTQPGSDEYLLRLPHQGLPSSGKQSSSPESTTPSWKNLTTSGRFTLGADFLRRSQ